MFKVLKETGNLDPACVAGMCESLEQQLNGLPGEVKIHSLHTQVIESTGKFLMVAITEVKEKATP